MYVRFQPVSTFVVYILVKRLQFLFSVCFYQDFAVPKSLNQPCWLLSCLLTTNYRPYLSLSKPFTKCYPLSSFLNLDGTDRLSLNVGNELVRCVVSQKSADPVCCCFCVSLGRWSGRKGLCWDCRKFNILYLCNLSACVLISCSSLPRSRRLCGVA